MIDFTNVFFNVENISNNDIILLGRYRLKPHSRADLFKAIPGLSEAQVIDALRHGGELHLLHAVNKRIRIIDFKLALWDNVKVDMQHLAISNSPERGNVLGFDGKELAWVSGGGSNVEVDAPLYRNGETLKLDRAGPNSSGYISKEDWLMFANISTGFRIWQYCDIGDNLGVHCRINSFNDKEITFNPGSIVNGSAVIVLSDNVETAPGLSWRSKLFNDTGCCVIQHAGPDVVLSRAPKEGERCRLYFLVVLPAGAEIPADYSGAPDYVRKMRSEYFDFIDLNSSKSEFIKGEKVFKSNIKFESGASVSGDVEVEGSVSANKITISDGAQANYVLAANSMGAGNWQANPLVSEGPPVNCYNGQLWVKIPDFESYVFDGTRGCWLGRNERQLSSWSTSLVAHNYIITCTGNLIPFNCKLVSIIASSEGGVGWTAEIHRNNSLVSGASIGVGADGRGFRFDLSADFNAGDKIQFFVNGHNIDSPKIEAIFRRSL